MADGGSDGWILFCRRHKAKPLRQQNFQKGFPVTTSQASTYMTYVERFPEYVDLVSEEPLMLVMSSHKLHFVYHTIRMKRDGDGGR
jgi:hypothetical protein